jgi:type I restriction enzyme S subunit
MEYSDKGILFIRSQNVYNTGLVVDEATYISEEIDEDMSNTRVFSNDVLLNITGGSIGRACLYPPHLPHANVNQHVCIIRINNILFLPQYIHYFWISNAVNTSINIYQSGANREGMNFEQINNTFVPYLKISMQKAIVSYLDQKCAKIDTAIDKKQSLIEKLTDYKKSLIYEAVTGKIEV